MIDTINQTIVFENTKPKDLYKALLSGKKLSKIFGTPAKIKDKKGSKYKLFKGSVKGKNLELIKNKMIVQTWRGAEWASNELDSIVLFKIEKSGEGEKDTTVIMVHSAIPEKYTKSIKSGWNEFYWNPLLAAFKEGHKSEEAPAKKKTAAKPKPAKKAVSTKKK